MEKLTRKETVELQNKRLRATIQLAYRTKLYSEKFKKAGIHPLDIRSIKDLRKIPFSSKDDFVKDFRACIGDTANLSVYHTTSGTTGIPTIVGFTNNDVEVQISIEQRNLQIIGIKQDDVVHNTAPYGMFFAGVDLHEATRRLGAVVIPAGKLLTGKQQAHIISYFRPTVILGIPQFILKWKYDYEEIGEDPRHSSLRLAYALGEPLPEDVRKRIENEWDMEVRLGYGLTEAGSGAECEVRGYYHWPEDQTYVEVIDPETGESLGEDEEGELVYTTLTRTGTIAVRFRSGDISRLIFGECDCGRRNVRIALIKHRHDNLYKIKGTLTSPYAIDEAILKHPEIRNYLFVIDKDEKGVDTVKIYVEAQKQKPEILNDLAQRLGGAICFTPAEVKYVPLGSIMEIGRKAKRFVDLRKDETYQNIVREFMKRHD